MPTGYTAGVVDGKITTLKEFATICMRAFGATAHLRDESLGTKYKPQIPSTYHRDAIDEAKEEIKKIEKMSDNNLIETEKKELLRQRKHYSESIQKQVETSERINRLLTEAKNYKPPTEKHVGLKSFMIQQLTDTLKWDGGSKYAKEQLAEIDNQLNILKAEDIRKQLMESAVEDLKYHEIKWKEEVERCEKDNAWVETLVESL